MTKYVILGMLGWCTIINVGILLLWFLLFASARNWVYRVHSQWFKISEEAFDTIHYSGMGCYKLGIILFNLIPYLALRIVV